MDVISYPYFSDIRFVSFFIGYFSEVSSGNETELQATYQSDSNYDLVIDAILANSTSCLTR